MVYSHRLNRGGLDFLDSVVKKPQHTGIVPIPIPVEHRDRVLPTFMSKPPLPTAPMHRLQLVPAGIRRPVAKLLVQLQADWAPGPLNDALSNQAVPAPEYVGLAVVRGTSVGVVPLQDDGGAFVLLRAGDPAAVWRMNKEYVGEDVEEGLEVV